MGDIFLVIFLQIVVDGDLGVGYSSVLRCFGGEVMNR